MRSFYTDTVTRLRPQTSTDAHNPTRSFPDWTQTPTSSTLSAVRFQMVGSDEEINLRFGVQVDARLLASTTLELDAQDRVVYNNVTYEIVGQPIIHRGATGAAAHSETRLRVFRG